MPRAEFVFPIFKLATLPVAFCVGVILSFSSTVSLSADGSQSSNPDLLRGAVDVGCATVELCADVSVSSVETQSGRAVKFQEKLPNSLPIGFGSPDVPGNCVALAKSGVYSPECRPAGTAAPLKVQKSLTVSPLANETISLEAASTSRVRTRPVEKSSVVPVPAPRTVSLVKPIVDETSFTGDINNGPSWLSDDAIDAVWGLGLRGSIVVDNAGTTYEAVMTPSGSITFLRPSGTTVLSGTTSLTQSSDGSFRVGAGNLAANLTETLNRDTSGTLGLSLALTQDDDDDGTITSQPFIASGVLSAGLTRSLGRIALGGALRGSRQYVSETGLSDSSWTDNTYRSYWNVGATARASYELTPIVGVFGQVDIDRAMYDAISPSTNASQDAWTYQIRGGLNGAWRSGLSGEIYGGYALRYFDNTSLAETGDWIYGGSLAYAPQRGFTLSAALDSAISDPGTQSDATARFDHTLSVGASYQLNERVTARASFGATWTRFSNSAATENDYSAGIGADYVLSKNATLNGDYSVTFEDDSGVQDTTHRISAGLTLSR